MMTDRQRELKRENNRRYRENNPEAKATSQFLWRVKNKEHIDAYTAAWRAANPEKVKAWRQGKKFAMSETRRRKFQRRSRRRTIAACKDKTALGLRILANVNAVVPKTIPADARSDIVASMVAAVYSGELRIRPSGEDAKAHISAHFRLFTKFGPESLDAPRFSDGSGSYHDVLTSGLWQ